jgi:vitamin B12 transporter
MNKKKVLLISGLVATQLSTMLGANAQEIKKLDDVVITATKHDQKQSQTGKVVSLITRETLERSKGKSLPELLTEQAGIVVAGASSNVGLNKSLFVRGAGSAYAVILIDGIVQNDPAGNGGSIDLRLISIDLIDHIEIIKGGQSTIYGSDAVGGVINIITKKGGPKGNTIYGLASVGSYETYKGTIGLNGSVDNFDYNLNYTHHKSDGLSEAANPPGNTTVFDKDGFKADAVNANFGIKLDKHFSVNPFVRYYYGDYQFDDSGYTDANNASILKNTAIGTNAKLEWLTGKINLNYSYELSSNVASGTYPSNTRGSMNLIDLYYNQKIGNKLDLLVGLDNRELKINSAENKPITNIFATYASLFFHDLSVFNLEVAGRYNKHKQYGENYTYNITPSINLIKELKLYGTISTGFKTPTLSMLFGPFGANLDLKPEKSQNYEAGLDVNIDNSKYTLRLTAYKRDLKDAIIYNYPTGYINQINQKVKGFEVEPAVQLGKFDLKGYYAFVEGDEFNFIDNAKADYLFRRPKHTFGVTAGYQATERLFVSANYRYFGKRTDGDYLSYKVENLPAYKLLNLYAEYNFIKDRLKIFIDAKNILNEKYTEVVGYNSLKFNFNAGLSFNIR